MNDTNQRSAFFRLPAARSVDLNQRRWPALGSLRLSHAAKSNQIVTRISCGLGNQLFQYAAGRALALRLGLPLVLDQTWFSEEHEDTPRAFGLDAFPIAALKASPPEIEGVRDSFAAVILRTKRRLLRLLFTPAPSPTDSYIVEPSELGYWPAFNQIEGPAYIAGYWQFPAYFAAAADTIRADLAFPPLPKNEARDVAAQMLATRCSVSIHVRRGDFITDPAAAKAFGGICTPAYYAEAIDRLAAEHGDLDLFLFSDDADWVRANFDRRGHGAMIVDLPAHRRTPHHDLHLMSLARHHVTANSSFSWWGAWLRRSEEGTVIRPPRLYADQRSDAEHARFILDRFPPSWQTVDPGLARLRKPAPGARSHVAAADGNDYFAGHDLAQARQRHIAAGSRRTRRVVPVLRS